MKIARGGQKWVWGVVKETQLIDEKKKKEAYVDTITRTCTHMYTQTHTKLIKERV